MPFVVGDIVGGRYEVQAVLGPRPLGALYRARERELGVEVALRVIGADMLSDEAARQAFAHKIGRARAFAHPNLVRVFAVMPTGDEVVVAVQWAPGQTLGERIAHRPLTVEEARPILAQVAAGMTHAHQHGVVLGDVHAQTVVLLGATVKISNVGIGPALPRKRFLDAVKASPGYAQLSPEIKSGMTADTRADVYALGMLAVEMLTGGSDRTKVSGSAALATVLARALADDPLVRHGSVDALHGELDAALSGQPARPRRPTPPVGVPVVREPSGPSRAAPVDKTDKPAEKLERIEDATAPVPKDPFSEETRAMGQEELDLLKGDQITRQVPLDELFPLRVASSDTQQFELEMVVDDDEHTSEELQLEKTSPGTSRPDDLKTDQVHLLEPDAAKTTEHPRLPPPVNEDEIDTARVTRTDVDEIIARAEDEPDPNATPLPPPAPPGALTPPPPAPPGPKPAPPVSLADSKDAPTKVEVPEAKVHISVELPVIEVQEAPPPSAAPAAPPRDEPLYGEADEEAPTRASGPALGPVPPSPSKPPAAPPPSSAPPRRRNPFDPAPPDDDAATREHKSPPPRRRNPFEPIAEDKSDTGERPRKKRKPAPKPTLLVSPIGQRRGPGATVLVVAIAAFIAAVGVALAISHVLQQQRLEQERREKQRLAEELNARAEAMKQHAPVDAGTAPAPVVTKPEPALSILPRSGPCPLGAHLVGSGAHAYCIDLYEYPGGNTMPRTTVSFEEAGRICAARGERLCTEGEWEHACRGKGGASYPYGQAFEAGKCNTKGPGGEIVASGSFAACKSAVGAYDMSGNVAEWVASGAQKGGAATAGARESRCSAVVRNPSPEGSVYVGFRCCAEPAKK